jgi:putative ABC transport system permease protein
MTMMTNDLYRIPWVVRPGTYAFSAIVVLLAAAVSALLVRRKLDHMDLVEVLKARE